jgi:hypothetical protein
VGHRLLAGYQDVPTFECQRRNTAPWWPGIQASYSVVDCAGHSAMDDGQPFLSVV